MEDNPSVVLNVLPILLAGFQLSLIGRFWVSPEVVIALNEPHVRRIAREYIAYYHEDRTHLRLDKDTPLGRPVESKADGARVESLPRVGGLHHRYIWKRAA
jgi:hypothetical protein